MTELDRNLLDALGGVRGDHGRIAYSEAPHVIERLKGAGYHITAMESTEEDIITAMGQLLSTADANRLPYISADDVREAIADARSKAPHDPWCYDMSLAPRGGTEILVRKDTCYQLQHYGNCTTYEGFMTQKNHLRMWDRGMPGDAWMHIPKAKEVIAALMAREAWKDAPEWAMWKAMDKDGQWIWSEYDPAHNAVFMWIATKGRQIHFRAPPFNGPWQDSKQLRPKDSS